MREDASHNKKAKSKNSTTSYLTNQSHFSRKAIAKIKGNPMMNKTHKEVF